MLQKQLVQKLKKKLWTESRIIPDEINIIPNMPVEIGNSPIKKNEPIVTKIGAIPLING